MLLGSGSSVLLVCLEHLLSAIGRQIGKATLSDLSSSPSFTNEVFPLCAILYYQIYYSCQELLVLPLSNGWEEAVVLWSVLQCWLMWFTCSLGSAFEPGQSCSVPGNI